MKQFVVALHFCAIRRVAHRDLNRASMFVILTGPARKRATATASPTRRSRSGTRSPAPTAGALAAFSTKWRRSRCRQDDWPEFYESESAQLFAIAGILMTNG
jgi:hypothetical protein